MRTIIATPSTSSPVVPLALRVDLTPAERHHRAAARAIIAAASAARWNALHAPSLAAAPARTARVSSAALDGYRDQVARSHAERPVTLAYVQDGVGARLTEATLSRLPGTAQAHARFEWTTNYTWKCQCGADVTGTTVQDMHAAHITARTGAPTRYIATY